MKKKLVIILLCGMMSFNLVACGGGESAGGSNSGSSENIGTTNESGDNKDNEEDKKEKVIKKTYESTIYANGAEQNYSYYEYDEKGREVLYKARYTAGSGEEETITTTWEEKGNTAIGTTSAGVTITNEYDAEGNLLSTERSLNGTVISKTTNTYQNGVLMESYQESTPTASMKQVIEIKYDKNGNFTYYKLSYNDEVKSLTEQEYTYNANGDIETIATKTTAYIPSGEQVLETTTEYVYDNGILVGTTSSNSSRADVKCDKNGNVLEQSTYDANGNLTQKTTSTYY